MERFVPATLPEVAYRLCLDSAARENADLWDSWRIVESKIQTILTIGGVYVAAAFAYVTQAKTCSLFESACLATAILSIGWSIWKALSASRIVSVDSPHLGAENFRQIDTMVRSTNPPESLRLRMEQWTREMAEHWSEVNEGTLQKLKSKQAKVLASQNALFFSTLAVMLLVLASVANSHL